MYTGNVWGIALLIAGFLATLIGFQLLLGALWTRRLDAAVRTLRERTIGSGLIGVVGVAILVVAAAALGQLGGPGKFASAVVLVAGAFPIVAGLAAVSRAVGERMPSPADEGRPWRATLRGGVTCGLAFVVPLVGWFVILPASIVMGLGAVALSAVAPSGAMAADAGTRAAA